MEGGSEEGREERERENSFMSFPQIQIGKLLFLCLTLSQLSSYCLLAPQPSLHFVLLELVLCVLNFTLPVDPLLKYSGRLH